MLYTHPVRNILKCVQSSDVLNRLVIVNLPLLQLILPDVIQPQGEEHKHCRNEAGQYDSKGKKVPRGILLSEYLRANGVTCRPGDKIERDDDRLLGLTGHVPGHQRESETDSAPEAVHAVPSDKQTDLILRTMWYRTEDSGTSNGRQDGCDRWPDGLLVAALDPDTRQHGDDLNDTSYHLQQLDDPYIVAKRLDNNSGKGADAARGESCEDLDKNEGVHCGVVR